MSGRCRVDGRGQKGDGINDLLVENKRRVIFINIKFSATATI